MDTTLVILAAGIGSRFGGGVKQLSPVGPNGELLIDYSIHDALKAGFKKVVFIIREDIFDDFREAIGCRMEQEFSRLGIAWEYVFQTMEPHPEGRKKPWGTGQAVLACKDVIDGPFAVINSDDYYGVQAFRTAQAFLSASEGNAAGRYGMITYILKNTLSDHGAVTRGVCKCDAAGKLSEIQETKGIIKQNGKAVIPDEKTGQYRSIPMDALVNMNFLLFPAPFIEVLESGFAQFLQNLQDPLKDEFLLPIILDGILKKGGATVQSLPSSDTWFGMTYKEDTEAVRAAFARLHEQGIYTEQLFSDLS